MRVSFSDYVLGFVIVVSLVGLSFVEGCGTDNNNRSMARSPSPNSLAVDTVVPPQSEEVEPTVVEVCNYTKLNKRRIRRFLCKKRKNKKACRRKVNRLLRKSKRFPRSLGESND